MCGRYTLHTEKEALAARFGFDLAQLAALAPRYNVAPTDSVLAVRMREGARVASLLRWGLVPYFAKAIGALPLMINARVEGVAKNAAFRDSLREKRCLIPADGFYEWQKAGPLARRKVPHFIGLRSGEPFAMAGLWARCWRPKDEISPEPLYSCTILTAPANTTVAPLHDRMPVILPREAEARWLDPALDDDVDALLALLRPVPADALEAHPVSIKVNSVKNDDPSLLEPSSEDPQLGFF